MSDTTTLVDGRQRRTADADVPARVIYLTDGRDKRAAVVHPLGERHENALATCNRLVKRGYKIVPAPTSDILNVSQSLTIQGL